jgi:hypothetical protein
MYQILNKQTGMEPIFQTKINEGSHSRLAVIQCICHFSSKNLPLLSLPLENTPKELAKNVTRYDI